ncbi:MAG: hypothetical protein LUQ22_03380 [Methanotrichaceae archaeon]|nr:hypothetical protein [Methanotrichaceae archaeon]
MVAKIFGPELMAEAEKIVKSNYPTAVQVEDVGISSKGSAYSAEEFDQWKFIFTDIDGIETITLDYSRGEFDRIDREAKSWTKTQIRELPRNMNLEQALGRLRYAGHKESIQSITLSAASPQEKGSNFIFKMGKKLVYIDASSGEVRRVMEEE